MRARSDAELPTDSDDDDDDGHAQRPARPPQKKPKPVLDEANGARVFLNATLARNPLSSVAMRYPSTANAEKLALEGTSLYALYAEMVFNPVPPATFAALMREFKGHSGACAGGCGCLIDGVNHLKKIEFLTNDHSARYMLGNLSDMQLLHSKHKSDLDAASLQLVYRLHSLKDKTTRKHAGAARAAASRSPQSPAPRPAPSTPDTSDPPALPELPDAALRTDLPEVERVTDLLFEAVAAQELPEGEATAAKEYIAKARQVLRRSLMKIIPPMNDTMNVKLVQLMTILAEHPKIVTTIRDEGIARRNVMVAEANIEVAVGAHC